MRRLRAWFRPRWEFALSCGLFLICVYAAVFFVINKAFGAAGFALFCAHGFFQALRAFADSADLRRCMGLDEVAEDGEGH